jgi:hypothetical protein
LEARLKIIDSLLVELRKLEQKKPIRFVEVVLGGQPGLASLLGLDHVRAGLLQLVLLLELGLTFETLPRN